MSLIQPLTEQFGCIQVIERHIVTAELLDLGNTPVELVAGQDGCLIPFFIEAHYHPGTTDFTNTDGVKLQLALGPNATQDLSDTTFLTNTTNLYYLTALPPLTGGFATAADLVTFLNLQTDQAGKNYTLGNGALHITVAFIFAPH